MPRWTMHPAGYAAVFLAELLFLSQAVDVEPLRRREGWWSWVGHLGWVAAWLVATGTAGVALFWRRLETEAAPVQARLWRRGRRFVWFLGLHAACTAAFMAASIALLPRGGVPSGERSEPTSFALAAWFALGLGWMGSLVLWATPLSVLRALVRGLWRELLASVAIGGLAVAAGVGSDHLLRPLSRATFELVVWILSPFVGVVSRPEVFELGTDRFVVHISPQCSGYEGAGLVFVVLGAYVVGFRHELRWLRAWGVVALAVVAVWLANAVRIASLVAVGTWWSPAVAVGGFHSKAGWVLFCVIALLAVRLFRHPRVRRADGSRASRGTSSGEDPRRTRPIPADESGAWLTALGARNPTAAYLGPLIVFSAASLLVGSFEMSLERGYLVRVAAVSVALWAYRGAWPSCVAVPSVLSVVVGGAVGAAFVAWPPEREPAVAALEELASLGSWERMVWLSIRGLSFVVVAPWIEELAFRGYALRRLASARFESVSWRDVGLGPQVGSAVIFGILHPNPILGVAAGLAFGYVAKRSGSLAQAVASHAVANMVVALDVIACHRLEHWL